MEIDTKSSSGMMNGLPPTNKETRGVGPIVSALVIVLLIIVVTLYFFGQRLNTQNTEQESTNTPATINQLPERNDMQLSSTTDTELLEEDLDKQLEDIDYSF